MRSDVGGLHHVTAIVGEAQAAVDFYAGVLGLHLGTLTVNFEDLLQHHCYFGDATGAPGTVFTVFPDPYAEPGRVGPPQPVATAFRVPAGSLSYWQRRLEDHDVAIDGPFERFDETILRFEDPAETRLELVAGANVDDGDATTSRSPSDGPIPLEYAITGLGGVSLLSVDPYATASTLETLGFEYDREHGTRVRYRAPSAGQTVVDVLDRDAPFGREGPGTIHHVAVSASSEDELREWRERFDDRGYDVSRVKDRHFFHSLYVREPGGILFELATDSGGVAVRDPAADDRPIPLYLPEWFEPDRDLVERQLPTLTDPTATDGDRAAEGTDGTVGDDS